MAKKKADHSYIMLLFFWIILVVAAYVLYQFYTFSFGKGVQNITLFGFKIPPLFPFSLAAVDTELNFYSGLINDILIVSGAVLGFYSLISIELAKTLIKAVKSIKGERALLTRLLIIIPTAFLMVSIYVILFSSVMNGTYAAVDQGYVNSMTCMKAVTLSQLSLVSSNKTSGVIDCYGVPQFMQVQPSQQNATGLGEQLSSIIQSENQYKESLFQNTFNSAEWLEAAFFMIPLLILTYALLLVANKEG